MLQAAKTSSLLLIAAMGLAIPAAAALAAGESSDGLSADVSAIWNDPVFQKQFIAGYGFNADIEPRVTVDEVKVLEKVRPLMGAETEDLPKAEATLLKLIKPDSSPILDFTLGGIQFQQGGDKPEKLAEALANYEKAVAKFPSFRRAYRNIGLIQVRNGKFNEAIKAFTKMIELGGGDSTSYGLLGLAYASKQDYQAAEVAYRNALLLDPNKEDWRLGLTRCVFRQNKFEDAATLLDGLLEQYPDKADFWVLQAHTHMGLKQPLKAAEYLEVLDRLGKAKPDNLHMLGDIYLTEGINDLAARSYIRAVDLDTGSSSVARPLREVELLASRGGIPQARLLLAHLREIRMPGGDASAAVSGAGASGATTQPVAVATLDEAERRKLLKLDARLTMAEGEAGGEQAVAVLEEIVKLDPLDGEALMLLGQHYARPNAAAGAENAPQADPDKAIFYFERAEGIETFEATAKTRHAQILVSMGRYADAIPLLRRAQEIKPREDIARYLEQIERISRSRGGAAAKS